MLLTSLFLTLSAQAAQHAPNEVITNAVVIDVPPSGLAQIVELIPALVPLEVPVDDVYFADGLGWGCVVDVWFNITNLLINASVVDAQITPQDGYLDFTLTLDVAINDALNPFGLDYELTCIEYNCQGYIDPFHVDVSAQIALLVNDTNGDGINDLDAQFNNFTYAYDITGTDINIENCALGTFEDVLNIFGWSIYDVIIGFASSSIEGLVTDMVPTLESTIEDTFSQLTIQQSVDLGGTTLDLYVAPENIQIKPEGLRLQMNGASSVANVAPCIIDVDPGGSLSTPENLMPIGTLPSGINADFIANVDDDFINQALYSIWRGGLLCMTIDENTFPLDTSILNLLTDDAFVELFPQTQPMTIETQPNNAPTLKLSTPDDLAVSVEDLGLNFFATVDGRRTRVLNVGLATDVGVNIPFNSQTGELSVDIVLNSDEIIPSVKINEFYPEKSGDIEGSFVGQLDTILGLVDIPGMIGDLNFALPSMNGVGLSSLEIAPTGANRQILGAYATIDEVPYEGGCAGTGDSGSGCGGGCSSQNPNALHPRLALLLGLMGFALLRRRSK